ncbi:MAG: ComF family protein [Roseovarius sp.]|nr:ComF family protein [Roseovarius sp.]
MMPGALQTALRLVYPPRCTLCGTLVDSDFGLCGPCWRDTPFIAGLVCRTCGTPLPGTDDGEAVQCDDCLATARPWSMGRAAMLYRDNARKLILGLKHGDRQDVVRPATLWLARAARPLVSDDMLIAPVPLHWARLLRRRYNQSALLARALARHLGLPDCPDLLRRRVRTPVLDGMGAEARFGALSGAIAVHPARAARLRGRTVLLVDDVMTSGATLAAAALACLDGGARDVRVLVLARVTRDT